MLATTNPIAVNDVVATGAGGIKPGGTTTHVMSLRVRGKDFVAISDRGNAHGDAGYEVLA